MTSTNTRSGERVLEDLAYVAGGEAALERALRSFVQSRGRTPTGEELVNYVADVRIAELSARLERTGT